MEIDPGELRESVRFDPRSASAPDDLGNIQVDFDATSGVTCRAKFLMRPGSEAMTEARLAGRQPVTVIIRWTAARQAITPDWRMVDLRTGRVYAIQAAEDMDRTREWLTFVCEAGVQP